MKGHLTLIIGPMKSGKSLELIARMSELRYTNLRSILLQPSANVREDPIKSRIGVELPAKKLQSLKELDVEEYDAVGIDEVFMFDQEEVELIKDWLMAGKKVIVSSLDLFGTGEIPAALSRLYRLGPDETIKKFAVCEICKSSGAGFSQVLQKGQVLDKLPGLVPEDGEFEYRAACRDCYFK